MTGLDWRLPSTSKKIFPHDRPRSSSWILDPQGMANLLEVILIVHRSQDAKLFSMVKATENQKHHAPEVHGDVGLRGRLLEAVEVLLPSDDILLHRFTRFPPDRRWVESCEKQLIDLHRLLCSDVITKGSQQHLHAGFRCFSFTSCPQFAVLQLPHSFVCRSTQASPQVKRCGYLKRILAITAVEKIPASLLVLLEAIGISGVLRNSIPVTFKFRCRRHPSGGGSTNTSPTAKQKGLRQPQAVWRGCERNGPPAASQWQGSQRINARLRLPSKANCKHRSDVAPVFPCAKERSAVHPPVW